jgi:DNA-binding FadR family transcriptional regulator
MPPRKIVEPQRLYRQIAGQLRTLINQGKFVAGSRLPSERDLAKQLEVSRPSVREALKVRSLPLQQNRLSAKMSQPCAGPSTR